MKCNTTIVMNTILFDLSFVTANNYYSGVAKYGYRILEYIVKAERQDEYVLLLNEESEQDILETFPQFKSISMGSKWLRKVPLKSFVYMWLFRKKVNSVGAKLLFCPYGNPFNCLKVKPKKISVVHDLQVRIDAHLRSKKEVWIYTFAENHIMNNSTYIFTISNFSRNQILQYYPQIADKLINMSNSVSMMTADTVKPMQIGNPYLLYVGRIVAPKNVLTLVKAFSLIKKDYPLFKLVLVGKETDYWRNEIIPVINEHELSDSFVLVEGCSEKELCQWYKGASCFVFPSIREGFGFPPIEAAFFKVPVVSSKADSLEEVTLGLLNYYDPPSDEKNMASVIKKVINNPPSNLELQHISDEYGNKYSIETVGKNICDFLQNTNKYQ